MSNLSSIVIRPAQESDAEAISLLAEMSHKHYAELLPHYIVAQPALYWKERFLTSLTMDNYTIMVAEETNSKQIAGYIETFLRKTASAMILPPLRLTVDNIVIAEDFQHQGIAKKLLEFIEQEARELGISMIELQVAAGNSTAIALYEKSGFSARLITYEKPLPQSDEFVQESE